MDHAKDHPLDDDPHRIASPKLLTETAVTMSRESHVELAAEILHRIFCFLEINEIKRIRLICKRWAAASQRALFRYFIFQPDRHDFGRFYYLDTKHMLSGTKALMFDLGTEDLYRAEALISNRYIAELRPTSKLTRTDFHNYIKTRKDYVNARKDAAVLEYSAWNTRWHLAQQNYRDLRNMESVFRRINTLERLDITYKNRNFKSEYLQLTWIPFPYSSSELEFGDFDTRAKGETITILRALESCPGRGKLRQFTHDKLPLTFFIIKKPVLENLSTLFRNLTTFHVQLEEDVHFQADIMFNKRFASEKWMTAWTRLGQLLAVMENLEDLRFGIDRPHNELEFSSWEGDTRRLGSLYIPLGKVLGERRWKSLKGLRIEGLLLCEQGLLDVIGRHSETLQNLNLKHIGLWEGNFRNLLTLLKPVLNLNQFRIWGTIQSFHSRSSEEYWRFRPRIEPENESWSDGYKESYMRREDEITNYYRSDRTLLHEPWNGLSSEDAWNSLLEYMHSPITAPWPLNAMHVIPSPRPHQQFGEHSEACTDCKSAEEIAQRWDDFNQQRTAEVNQMVEWTAQKIRVDRVVSEEQIKPFYFADGFDMQGYDKNGFDRYGVHMEAKPKEGNDSSNNIVDMTVRREMLKQIPRYVQAGMAPTFSFPVEKRNYNIFLGYPDIPDY